MADAISEMPPHRVKGEIRTVCDFAEVEMHDVIKRAFQAEDDEDLGLSIEAMCEEASDRLFL